MKRPRSRRRHPDFSEQVDRFIEFADEAPIPGERPKPLIGPAGILEVKAQRVLVFEDPPGGVKASKGTKAGPLSHGKKNTRAPAGRLPPLKRLEEKIEECLTLASSLGNGRLDPVISLLSQARTEVAGRRH